MAKGCRVQGIYQEGNRWRVVCWVPERKCFKVATREEAEQIAATIERQLRTHGTRTIGEALDEHLAEIRRSGYKPSSIVTVESSLRLFLPLGEELYALTPQRAAELYQAETQRTNRFGRPVAAASQRAVLKRAKAFFRWAKAKGYIEASPFENVKPVGRVNTGKPQLRLHEARQLTSLLIEKGEQGDEGAVAALTQLVLGLRSSEVLHRRVRDVDDDGRIFWIDGGKTKNARRALRVQSPPLERLLRRQIEGKQPGDLLFGTGRAKPYTNPFLWKRLQRYCQEANVPPVCPHSLRGLHSTLAIEQGATSGLVSTALGHGSFAITARHYVEPSALANANQRKVTQALAAPSQADLLGRLERLSPEKLARLLDEIDREG